MPRSKPDPALAATVRRLREGQGITREALALEAGITTGSLARLELGYGSPSWDTLGRVAAALGLSVVGLVGAVEDAVAWGGTSHAGFDYVASKRRPTRFP